MTQPACLPALLLAAGILAIAAPRLGLRPPPLSARARARTLRAAMAVAVGLFAVALALSLVGVNGGAADWSPTIRIGLLASLAVAALLMGLSRGPGAERR